MAQRVTLRKRQPYNTTSNRRRVVKTPGGKLVVHHLKKIASAPKCGDCGFALAGIPVLRPRQYATLSKRQKTVQRAYGGSVCATCVKQRYVPPSLLLDPPLISFSLSPHYPSLNHIPPLPTNDKRQFANNRITRAFLIEEATIVKRMLKDKVAARK
ncbi:hypothetical protein B9479_007120 [Cryptococcus floricola]|uniref:Large ribosomal subunit protein eL34 n=1 Tax=Cryptococcus floricola TaxID=2591691 RepID=A0A5D3AL80_9TREE|nr:hypothetical protein B9479_007120 [Cryptococcus floricola]